MKRYFLDTTNKVIDGNTRYLNLKEIENPEANLVIDKYGNLGKGSSGSATVSWEDISSKPAVIAAGTTQEQARSAIGAGTSNYVLPSGGTATTFLRGDGTWVIPTNTTYTPISQASVTSTTSTAVGLVTGQRVFQAYSTYINGGVASFTGNDVTESFTIPHGLGVVPRFHVCNRNADGSEQAALFTSMADATNINIMFTMAPANGIVVMINWMASK